MLGQRTSVTSGTSLTKYYYDGNYQLNKTDYPSGAPFNSAIHSWTYDAIGNRLTNTINGVTQNYTYYVNAGNTNNGQRLQSDSTKTYTYDYNGNMVSDGTNTYTWDKDNRLTGITGSVTASYKYDYSGRRFSKTVNSVTSTYIYEGQNLIAERGAATVDYVFGRGIDEPLAMTSGGTSYDYSVDGLGSTAAMTTTTGTLSRTYTYDSWGNIAAQTGSVPNPFTFTSRESSEVGLMYYRARYYNPNIGRFIREDPIISETYYAWHSAEPNPIAGLINWYSYVGNAPILLFDPTGEKSKWRFGNYCGPGHEPGWPEPKRYKGSRGSVDECCMNHDMCYEQHFIKTWNVLIPPLSPPKQCALLNCDQSMCHCVLAVKPRAFKEKVAKWVIGIFFCIKSGVETMAFPECQSCPVQP
jgi:RHS repeat-associated protein